MAVKKLAKRKMKRFIWNCALWAEYIKRRRTGFKGFQLNIQIHSANIQKKVTYRVSQKDVLIDTEWRYQNFDRNRYRDFFYDTKFSETETFFRDQIFPKPKPRLFSETKLSGTETETLKNLAKVSRLRPKPRLLNIFWNEIRIIWDLQAKLEFLGPKFGTLIVNWVKIISAI